MKKEFSLTDRIKYAKKTRWMLLAYALLFMLTLNSLIQASIVEVDRVFFFSKDLPKAFDGYKIVYVSDIHDGLLLDSHSLDDLAGQINSENPDCILLGGDYIQHDRRTFPYLANRLKDIHAKDGIYGVMGNHDIIYAGTEDTKWFFNQLNVTDIENTNVRIERNGAFICLSGAEEALFGRPAMNLALSGINEGDFNIFVTHNPLLFANGENSNYNSKIDLALMGHTHGGQISFFGLWGFMADGVASFYRPTLRENSNGMHYIISNGFGTVVVPLRFFAPPQIQVITLKCG
jgi:uncharacterized protein